MKNWRRRVLLLRQQLEKIGLLAGGWLQHQGDIRKRKRSVHATLIDSGLSPGIYMAVQHHPAAVVDASGDAALLGCLRGCQKDKRSKAESQRRRRVCTSACGYVLISGRPRRLHGGFGDTASVVSEDRQSRADVIQRHH